MRAVLTSILFISTYLTSMAEPVFKLETLNEVTYRYMIVEPETLRIVRVNDQGKVINTFRELRESYDRLGVKYIAAMNGGIFEPGKIPTGLLIQDKKELSPLNLKKGAGNFFLKPNGVFYLTQGKAGVIDSSAYKETAEKAGEVIYATQSGPLLLSDGKIHPKFKQGSDSQKLRNGVGILDDGRVILAISNRDSMRQPNLHAFASFFLSKGCKNALYLDGTISEFRERNNDLREGRKFSSFLVVEEKKMSAKSK